MRLLDRIRGRVGAPARLAVAAIAAALLPAVVGLTGGSATAAAFSRPGLPVEYLMVPSPSMGRRHQDPVPERWPELARRLPARRLACAGRLQWLGHQHPGVRVVRLWPVARDARWRAVQLLRRLVPAGPQQGPDGHLQVGDLPDLRAAELPGIAEAGQADRKRGRRSVDGGLGVADPVGLPPAAVHLRVVAVRVPEPLRRLVALPDRDLDG